MSEIKSPVLGTSRKRYTYDDFPEIEENRKQWEKDRITQQIISFNREISELINELVNQGYNVLTTKTDDELPLFAHLFNKHTDGDTLGYQLETEFDNGKFTVRLTEYKNSKTMFSTEHVCSCLDGVVEYIKSKIPAQ